MKPTSVIASAALTIAVLSTGCKTQRNDRPIIWIGNADLSDSKDVIEDFSNAFASDPLCHNIRIETHDFPKGPHWFLETYSAESSGSGAHEFSDGISWWMNHNNGKEDVAWFDGSDDSSVKAAHHVCFIIKGKGGEVD